MFLNYTILIVEPVDESSVCSHQSNAEYLSKFWSVNCSANSILGEYSLVMLQSHFLLKRTVLCRPNFKLPMSSCIEWFIWFTKNCSTNKNKVDILILIAEYWVLGDSFVHNVHSRFSGNKGSANMNMIFHLQRFNFHY